ncbi:YegP family protein [Phenylobacterium sp.]|uniref:YegP family protein n=1 Tax=Phenylobacterium sp. TaxID=1871053 RepID=UPI002B71C0CA|nr:DUF1508 domain-containing protein [Phenylobacterium sp.]HVI33048.1 DUF1508 domain-containing protein [Phenylobacterium sp.]
MYYSLYTDSRGQYRWRLQAGNNRIIADSGESYVNRADCLAAINLVKASGAAPIQ